MAIRIQLTHQEIDSATVLESVGDVDAGANLVFLGTTRGMTDGKVTASLRYDAYEVMAEQELNQLAEQACQRWPLKSVCIVHRLGSVAAGVASMAVAVSSPHRAEAFAAASWLIDEIKRVVPVWKQEIGEDGATDWVHPAEGVNDDVASP